MNQRSIKRGYTLTELLAYLGLLLLITIFSGSFVINGLRYYRMLDVETSLQQSLMISMDRLVQDMNSAGASSLIVESGGVIMASPRTSDGTFVFSSDGSMLWQKWICYYVRNEGKSKVLAVKEAVISPASTDYGTSPYTTVSSFAAAPVPERIVARDIKSLNVENAGYAGGYKITLILDKTTDSTKPSDIEGVTEVYVKN